MNANIIFIILFGIGLTNSLPVYMLNNLDVDGMEHATTIATTPDPEYDLGPAHKLPTDSPNEMMEINIDGTEWINYNSNEYKWNKADHGPKMTISEDGFISNYSGENVYNCVRAVLPIPEVNMTKIKKPTFGFYFEVQILVNRHAGLHIGFCDKQFPWEGKFLGEKNNSISIWDKDGILIDGSKTSFGNKFGYYFKTGDFVGIGTIHHPNSKMEYFATWNGKLLGKVQLLSKFVDLQLFPAITLRENGDRILVNFGKDNWIFKEFEQILE